jgi:SAM-dependent methyltransferase
LSTVVFYSLYVLPALALLNFSSRRWRFAIAVALLLFCPLFPQSGLKQIAAARSFFGVYRIEMVSDKEGPILALLNGTTLHGAESLLPNEATVPLTYYSKDGPFGHFFNALSSDGIQRVAVIGLGTGARACYAKDGQSWTFYEIDPVVERLARQHFQFLEKCATDAPVVLGDARMTIAKTPDGTYDVLIIDAFSSDSIPMHLLTREALALYLRKLAPGGRLLFHISSRRLNLTPVVAALAADAAVPGRVLFDKPPPGSSIWRRSPAEAVVIARRNGDLNSFSDKEGWNALTTAGSQYLWTDQRADLLRVIRF